MRSLLLFRSRSVILMRSISKTFFWYLALGKTHLFLDHIR
jgi:hypothetical protein